MKTTALDFDAVLNTYKGWEGPDVEYPPREGVDDFLAELGRHRRIVIYSCRPVRQVRAWLRKHKLNKYIDSNHIDSVNRICTSDYTPESVSAYNAKVILLPLQKILERAQK